MADKKLPKSSDEAAAKKNVHAGHRQRMKDTFYKTGLKNMQPHQILEMVLFNTIPYIDTNGIAHELIDRFGSISGVFDASPEELLTVPGIKPATVFLLKLIPEVSRVYYADREARNGRVVSRKDAARLMRADFRGRDHEVVTLLLLSNSGKVLFHDILHEGSFNSVPIYKRRIIELCLKYNAASAVIAHNHPSGNVMPSKDDLRTTRALLAAMATINVMLYDHFIFNETDYISLYDAGLIEYINSPER